MKKERKMNNPELLDHKKDVAYGFVLFFLKLLTKCGNLELPKTSLTNHQEVILHHDF